MCAALLITYTAAHNFVAATHCFECWFLKLPPRYGAGEVFCPVCLPGYNPEAFLHAHIDYLDKESGIYLVLLTGR